ncbi:MAG: HD domain-containing protein [Coriobacteriaceae bacterium]|nr:HD domain-containing protein [Coriobacteriaceae bacterium]
MSTSYPHRAYAGEDLARARAVFEHPLYQEELGSLAELEADRVWCRHDLAHVLDVARIAWILNLEQGLGLAKDVVYAAALLHDIGRARQYRMGVPHHLASAELARQILGTLDDERAFDDSEVARIARAVGDHRAGVLDDALARLIACADKLSRPCHSCPAAATCNWPREKRNACLVI